MQKTFPLGQLKKKHPDDGEMALWSLIFKLDAGEYDAIPNTWLISKERCWYPDKSKSSTTKLARENAPIINQDDWIQLQISIVKKDFENFERCIKDAVRLNLGKRTLTASENEERGRGLRVKRSLYLSDSEHSTGSTPTKTPRKSPRKTTKLPELNFPKCPETPGKSKKSIISYKSMYLNIVTPNTTPKGCRFKRKHFCVLNQGPLSLEAIGYGICVLSRSLTVLRSALEDSHQDIVSRLPSAATSREGIQKAINVEEENEEDNTEVLAIFPINKIEEFQSFEEKLREEPFRKQVASALMSVASKTSYSRAVTSILRFVLHEEAVKHFSWKGQKRWSEKKLAFSASNFSKMLVDAIKKRWPAQQRNKIEQAIVISCYARPLSSI